MTRLRRDLCVGIFCLGCLGCSSAPPPATPAKPPEPCKIPRPHVTFAASERANAAAGGQGLPVQVRLYQMKSETRLRAAFFEEVWQNDKAVLQDDLLKKDEYTVYPGQSRRVSVDLMPDIRSLVAVALFREPQGKDWFVSYEIEPKAPSPPCPKQEPEISVWLDRMQIQDGQGRVQEDSATTDSQPALDDTRPSGGNPKSGGN